VLPLAGRGAARVGGGVVGSACATVWRWELHEPAWARPGQEGLVCSGSYVRSDTANGGGGGSLPRGR
jgi:hypothetical protein